VLVVESVARGEMPCSPRLAATLLQRVATLAQEQRTPSALATLTSREREIVASTPGTRVVTLGITDDDPEVLPLAEAGVAGYVTTEASADEIVLVVESVARGEMPCSPRLAATLLQRVATLAQEQRTPSALATLTSREREIVGLIGDGLSNKEIASGLCIEVATVKNHVHNILEKLNVTRRADAAALVRRQP